MHATRLLVGALIVAVICFHGASSAQVPGESDLRSELTAIQLQVVVGAGLVEAERLEATPGERVFRTVGKLRDDLHPALAGSIAAVDLWGNPIRVGCVEKKCVAFSLGPDGGPDLAAELMRLRRPAAGKATPDPAALVEEALDEALRRRSESPDDIIVLPERVVDGSFLHLMGARETFRRILEWSRAITEFSSGVGAYPVTERGPISVSDLPNATQEQSGVSLDAMDAWGGGLVYLGLEHGFLLGSPGPDGVFQMDWAADGLDELPILSGRRFGDDVITVEGIPASFPRTSWNDHVWIGEMLTKWGASPTPESAANRLRMLSLWATYGETDPSSADAGLPLYEKASTWIERQESDVRAAILSEDVWGNEMFVGYLFGWSSVISIGENREPDLAGAFLDLIVGEHGDAVGQAALDAERLALEPDPGRTSDDVILGWSDEFFDAERLRGIRREASVESIRRLVDDLESAELCFQVGPEGERNPCDHVTAAVEAATDGWERPLLVFRGDTQTLVVSAGADGLHDFAYVLPADVETLRRIGERRSAETGRDVVWLDGEFISGEK